MKAHRHMTSNLNNRDDIHGIYYHNKSGLIVITACQVNFQIRDQNSPYRSCDICSFSSVNSLKWPLKAIYTVKFFRLILAVFLSDFAFAQALSE